MEKQKINHFKGEIAVLNIELEANRRGYCVSYPRNQHLKYDLILDCDGKLHRVQIKYLNRKGRRKNTLSLFFKTPYSDKDIDIILVFLPSINKILKFTSKDFKNKSVLPVHLTNKNSKSYYAKYLW